MCHALDLVGLTLQRQENIRVELGIDEGVYIENTSTRSAKPEGTGRIWEEAPREEINNLRKASLEGPSSWN